MSAYSDKVIADGATAYWRLGETSGTTANSVVGNFPGTISGGVTLGQSGALSDGNKAMLFDATGEYVSIPNGAYAAIGTGPVTLECWIKTSIPYPGTAPFIIDNGGGAAGAGFGFFYDANFIYFKVANGTTYVLPGKSFASDGQWHHLVGVLRRGTTDVAEFYFDGIPVTPSNLPATGWNITSTRPLLLSTYSGGESSPDFRYTGLIDEVAIYPVALTPQQISLHYALRTIIPGQSVGSIPLGPPTTIKQGVTYALPACKHSVYSDVALEYTADGVSSPSGDAIVTCKRR